MTARRIARVLLDSPLPQLDRLFDYEIPDELAPEAHEGVRVRVPLRAAGRIVDGFIVELDDEPSADRPLSEVESVISSVPVLPRRLYDLARKVADRSAGSASDILRLVVPRRMVRAERSWQNAERAGVPDVSASTAEWAATALASFPGAADSLTRGARIALTAPTAPVTPDSPAPGWVGILAAAAARLLVAGRSSILVVPDHRDLDQLEQG
ncbi:MAG: primosomal protein N', partial [Micrococcales bacterium]|nr:primosomal protein N' [Micrococcales bacterium]